ncbi:MAG: autotransporter domain-containing protein [Pseudomonadota bacterium]
MRTQKHSTDYARKDGRACLRSEWGAGTLNRRIQYDDTESLKVDADLLVKHTIKKKFGSIDPYFSLGGVYGIINERGSATSYFQGSTTGIRTTGVKPDAFGAKTKLGIDFVNNGGYTTSLRYQGELKATSKTHIGDINFAVKF